MTASKFLEHQHDYSGIHLFNDIQSELPFSRQTVKSIAATIEEEEQCTFHLVEIAIVDKKEIIRVNREHLEHDYITDIISFRYDDNPKNCAIEGTLYCCGPRIEEQAEEFNQSLEQEFTRILIHGLLHLIGYEDKSSEGKAAMRKREDFYLSRI